VTGTAAARGQNSGSGTVSGGLSGASGGVLIAAFVIMLAMRSWCCWCAVAASGECAARAEINEGDHLP